MPKKHKLAIKKYKRFVKSIRAVIMKPQINAFGGTIQKAKIIIRNLFKEWLFSMTFIQEI